MRARAAAWPRCRRCSRVACETVDLGQPPSDINACRPSQQFFVDEIWPNFLAKDLRRQCTVRFDLPRRAGAQRARPHRPDRRRASDPADRRLGEQLPTATEQMNCSNVAASKLLELPPRIKVHGGGKLIQPDGPEATLIKAWVSQP
jgi:hypothetical protein